MQLTINKTLFLTIIIMMTVIGLLSTDIFLPSLPQISHDFSSNPEITQLTISLFLLGLSVSQLIYGPLSESFGRKKIILIGVTVYIIASIGCLFSPSIEYLIIFRLLQGVGACAGMTIGRAIIGDAFTKQESGKIFATVFPFVGLSPAIAPVIGGLIDEFFGWRAVFLTVLLLGLMIFILIILFLPETLSQDKRKPIHPVHIGRHYVSLIGDKLFIGYVVIPCIAYFAYFAYLTISPFILHAQGLTAKMIGLCYISVSISYVLGNLTSRKLLNYYGLNKVLTIGYTIFLISGVLMVPFNYFSFNLFLFLLPITCLTFANGFLIPLGSAGVIANFSHLAGYASGLLGFLQLGSASLTAAIVGSLTNGSQILLAYYIAFIAIIGVILFYGLIAKDKTN
ncbi:Multidrug transporter MdfA protein [Candidatus Hepatincola sp. Pdp]